MSDSDIKKLKVENVKLKAENLNLKQNKKYGLVWEDKPEAFDEQAQNSYPILNLKNDSNYPDINHPIESNNNKNPHILIEGDNYHVLSVLNVTHQKKIDVIYIDPPYNTGNKDFKYNDRFVDKEDRFRHSKWLSFMSKRLKLAQKLLKDDGVIFISIDDNEQANLKVLCDEIFGQNNFITNMVWESNKNIMKGSNHIRKDHEYISVYQNRNLHKIRLENTELEFQNIDNDPNGEWLNTNASYTNGGNNFAIELPNGDFCNRNWRFTEEEYNNGDINLYFNNGNVPRLKIYKTDYNLFTKTPSSLVLELATTTTGKNILANIFNCLPKDVPFDNPKDPKLISYLLSFKDKT